MHYFRSEPSRRRRPGSSSRLRPDKKVLWLRLRNPGTNSVEELEGVPVLRKEGVVEGRGRVKRRGRIEGRCRVQERGRVEIRGREEGKGRIEVRDIVEGRGRIEKEAELKEEPERKYR